MPPSRPSVTNQISLIVLWFFLHHLPSSHHQVVQTGYVFLIFVVVSVVFSVVSVLTFFFSYRLGLYTNHDLLYISSFPFFLSSFVQLYVIVYQRKSVDFIRGNAKGASWFNQHVSQYAITLYVYTSSNTVVVLSLCREE